tara:strand:+ start:1996 stop:2142 length:147 start_codon:yes stop_codon:yes gene_type:complete
MTDTETPLSEKFQELAEKEKVICDAQIRSLTWALDKIDAVFQEARASL